MSGIQFVLWYTSVHREQDYMPIFLAVCNMALGVLVYTTRDAMWMQILALAIVKTVVLFGARYMAVRTASDRICAFKKVLSDTWEQVLSRERDSRGETAALTQLCERAQAAARELECQHLAARCVVPLVRRVFQSPDGAFGRFSRDGKFLQRTRDLDTLFAHAQNPALQGALYDLLADWIAPLQRLESVRGASAPRQKKGSTATDVEAGVQASLLGGRWYYPRLYPLHVKRPERAIEKCVRCYRRDERYLTDILRTRIVAADFAQASGMHSEKSALSCMYHVEY